MRCNHDYLMADFSFYMRPPCLLAETLITIPNTAWLAVPEYVYNYMEQQGIQETTIIRERLNRLLEEAYLAHETFFAYTLKYSPLEAVAACERIQQQDFEDTVARSKEKLHQLVPTLYASRIPANQEQGERQYTSYSKQQQYIWRKYGTEVKGSHAKNRYFLSDLESFRGGLESDFTVAIYDELDEGLGMVPVKTYTLPFVLRRTQCVELGNEQFLTLLKRKNPQQGEIWQQALEQQRNLLGYIHVKGLIDGKANDVYFEISKLLIGATFHQVIRLQGFTIGGNNTPLRTDVQSINGRLKKQSLNCWVSEHNSFTLNEAKHLPPLFAIYPLHALLPNGKYHTWSVAFGLDAFFLECITQNRRRMTNRTDDTAIIL